MTTRITKLRTVGLNGSVVRFSLVLDVEVNREAWDMAYGIGEGPQDIAAHTRDIAAAALIEALDRVANGATLITPED